MKWYEVNFDGLVGPTHNYAGLSYGNLASQINRMAVSRPRQAARQGLAKMQMLHDLGIQQAILPPHLRPDVIFLRNCGFVGSDAEIIMAVGRDDPVLLAAASSSAFMWTANAATMSPSADTGDGRLHLTPANLFSGLHRSLESGATQRVLKSCFRTDDFVVHDVLPPATSLADEGAANQMRFAPSHGEPGIEVFVYGTDSFNHAEPAPTKYPARQTIQASQAIARLHQLQENQSLFWKQNPHAIDQGAFHNDVVAVGNLNVLLCHEFAFEDQAECLATLKSLYEVRFGEPLIVIEIENDQLPLGEAVKTYLFNSQIVSREDGDMILIAPAECNQSSSAKNVIDQILKEDNPIQDVHYPDVRQSMKNGGGPACLRLRVVMNENQLGLMHQPMRYSKSLAKDLESWIDRHYREQLAADELADPSLFQECFKALQELESLLELDSGVLVHEGN